MELKRGFTLIELLVVMAIIGILAAALLVSLGGARKTARDTTRISDLRNVQASLELFFNLCGHYPGNSSCTGSGNLPPGAGSGWANLTAEVTNALSITNFPKDPTNSGIYIYEYGVDTNNNNQSYALKATLEENNAALRNDIDGNSVYGLNCGSGTQPTEREYCVSL